MSLQLKISATEQKNSIILYECTGNYSINNKGGYGLPNPKIEDVSEAYFEVKTPSFIDGGDPIVINAYPSFPTNEERGYEVLPQAFGMKEIESGEYKIKYIVVYKDKNGSSFTKTAFYTLFCLNSVTCCVDKMVKGIRAGGFNDPKQQLTIELSNLLTSIKYQVDCGNTGIANSDLEYLKEQCKCCNCS